MTGWMALLAAVGLLVAGLLPLGAAQHPLYFAVPQHSITCLALPASPVLRITCLPCPARLPAEPPAIVHGAFHAERAAHAHPRHRAQVGRRAVHVVVVCVCAFCLPPPPDSE